MANEKFSQFDTENPALTDFIVGLHAGDNAKFTVQSISDLIQGQIVDVDPLPSGTYAKVMYYTGTNWGATNTLQTDGYTLSIGESVPAGESQISVLNTDNEYSYLFNLNNVVSSAQVGTMAFTKQNMLHVTSGGIPSNIDRIENNGIYSAYFEKGVIAHEHLFLNNLNGSMIKFGDVNATTGAFTQEASIFSGSDSISVKAKTVTSVDDSGIDFEQWTVDGSIRRANSCFFKIQKWHNILSAQSGGIILSTNALGSSSPDTSIRSALHIGGNNGGNTNLMSLSLSPNLVGHDDTQLFLVADKTGKIFMRLPTTAGSAPSGSLLQVIVDGSGFLKLA